MSKPNTAEEILNAKESYNFLQGAKRILVRVAMQEHTAQTLNRLKERIEKEIGSWDSDDRFNECKEQALKLIEEVSDE